MDVPENRTFGFVAFTFFVFLAGIPLLSGGGVRLWALYVALFFGVMAVIKPSSLAGMNILWTRFGLLLHRISNPIILAILFYVVLSPFGIVMRIFRKKQLYLAFDSSVESYWITRDPNERMDSSMINQF